MTTCEKMLNAVEKKVDDGLSAKEIGEELCDMVIDKKRKAKYLIGLLAAKKGVEYKEYVEKHPTLNLQPQKARKKPPKKKDEGSDEKLSDPKIPNVHISESTLEMLDEIKEEFDNEHPRENGKSHTHSSTIRKLIKMYKELKNEHPEIFDGDEPD